MIRPHTADQKIWLIKEILKATEKFRGINLNKDWWLSQAVQADYARVSIAIVSERKVRLWSRTKFWRAVVEHFGNIQRLPDLMRYVVIIGSYNDNLKAMAMEAADYIKQPDEPDGIQDPFP